MKQSKQNRVSIHLPWVDIYRGLAIFLIVVGHSWSPFAGFIYLFHVPAFFFISGLTSNFTKYRPLEFVVRRARSLLLPYFGFNLAFILFHAGIKVVGAESIFFSVAARSQYAFITALNGLFSFSVSEELGGATWFLMVLFSAQVFSYFLIKQKAIESWQKFWLILGGLLFISHFLFTKRWSVAYNWDLVPISTIFILIAYRYGKLLEKISVRWYLPLASLAFGVLWYFNRLGTAVIDFPSRSFHSLPVVVLTSLSGIVLLYILAKWFSWRPRLSALLTLLGVNSLWILGFHFAGFKLFHLTGYLLGWLPILAPQSLIPAPGNSYWLGISVFGILFSLVILWGWKQIPRLIKMRKNFSLRQLQIPLLLAVTVISNLWVISKNNFFYADDFGYMWLSKIQTVSSFLRLIPHQMYNDRPVGQFFIFCLIQIFQNNYQLIHAVLLGVHVVSVLLLFWLLQLARKKWQLPYPYFPLVAAMIFGAWPKSVFAVQWLSASFDLIAAPLLLLFLILIFQLRRSKKIGLSMLGIVIYGLMLRTKEVLLLVPLIPILFSQQLISFKQIIRKRNAASITVMITFFLMLLYAARLFFLAYSTKYMGFAGDSPYAVSLNPLSLLSNLGKYLLLLFNISDMSQTFQSLPAKSWLVGIGGLLIVMTFLILRSRHRKFLSAFLLAAVLLLVPVLPLKNMAHKLYLYLPMLGVAPVISLLICEYLPQKKAKPEYVVLMFVVGLLYVNLLYKPVVAERNWWKSVGAENQQAYQALSQTKISDKIHEVKLVNFPISSIYHFGNGDVIRYQFNRADLTISEVDRVATTSAGESTFIIKSGRND